MIRKLYANAIEWSANVLEALGVIAVLLLASGFQWYFGELPCPLCLLQRVGLFLVAIGFLMNMRFGFHPSHYSMVFLGALYTSFVALRQIALHVLPGTGAYGSPFWGYHLYTWSFVVSVLIMVATAIMLGFDRQYLNPKPQSKSFIRLTHLLFAILVVLVSVNLVSVIMECGVKRCPENPSHYLV